MSRSSQKARREITCLEVGYPEVLELAPIPSGYTTDRVFRLQHRREGVGEDWHLTEEILETPFHKQYDDGRVHDWLDPYLEVASLSALHFVTGRVDGVIEGMLCWQQVRWNNSLWLLDIRTRSGKQRQGIGTALVRHLQGAARSLRARGISVETQINNYPAIKFYRKQGFQVAGFHDHLYTNHDLREQDVALYLFWERR